MAAPEACVVLVRPAQVGNVAAACRAMKNMGLHDLRLVAPPADLASAPGRALAYGAFDVLDGARRCATLLEAVADARFVVATSARANPMALTPRALAAERGERGAGGLTALVFGPERTGLTAAELRLCHATVRIPAAAARPSLNLAQAVLIVAYELHVGGTGEERGYRVDAPPAPAGELETTLSELREGLLAVGYLNPANPDAILAELRRMLARAGPTRRELRLLRGLARQVGWAGRVAMERRGGG